MFFTHHDTQERPGLRHNGCVWWNMQIVTKSHRAKKQAVIYPAVGLRVIRPVAAVARPLLPATGISCTAHAALFPSERSRLYSELLNLPR